MSEKKPETINESISALYIADKYQKPQDFGHIASVIDTDTGFIAIRVKNMIETLDAVL